MICFYFFRIHIIVINDLMGTFYGTKPRHGYR